MHVKTLQLSDPRQLAQVDDIAFADVPLRRHQLEQTGDDQSHHALALCVDLTDLQFISAHDERCLKLAAEQVDISVLGAAQRADLFHRIFFQ